MWIGDKRFVPPYGEFSTGDDVSHLPQTVLDDLAAQGLVSIPQAQGGDELDAPIEE